MGYGIMLGADMFLDTTGVLTVVEDGGKVREFFRVREIQRVRQPGSYLAIDCDIRDVQGNREVKLAKSRPVAGGMDGYSISLSSDSRSLQVRRANGSLVS